MNLSDLKKLLNDSNITKDMLLCSSTCAFYGNKSYKIGIKKKYLVLQEVNKNCFSKKYRFYMNDVFE